MRVSLPSLVQAFRRLDGAVRRVEPAAHVGEISTRGWVELLWAAFRCTLRHRAPSQAAAATFYAFLAFVPAVAAFGSFYGLFSSPDRLKRGLDAFSDLAPLGVIQLVQTEALRFATDEPAELLGQGVGFVAVSLAAATSAVRVLLLGLTTAYGVEERRPWWRVRLLCLLFAAGAAVLGGGAVWLSAMSADLITGDFGLLRLVRMVLRWALLFGALVVGLAVFYRYGADRTRARWRWVTPGTMLAAAAGLITSACVTLYLARFAAYERTYGGLGSILGLMSWLWSFMVVTLTGAELNRALEGKTSADTSVTGREPP